ncbi:MAG: beta-ketoacyl-ACP synthase III [Rhodospirillaceae bacterium]
MPIISQILGCGSYLPENFLTNDQLAEKVETSDEWITARTGIKRRHVTRDDEYTSDLAYEASVRALKAAGVKAEELDLIVVGTTTPDRTFPATAVMLQSRLGMAGGAGFDVQAVCSGFIYALSVVDGMIKAGTAKTALVVGADTLSKILNWEDRTTSILFGDGAGAVVVRGEEVNGAAEPQGILSTHIHSDGNLQDLLYCDGGTSMNQKSGFVRMEGQEVFKHAVKNLAGVVVEALEANDLQPEDIDWLVPHQANKRIIDSTAKKLKMPAEKVVLTVETHANTSAASIPLALDAAVLDGRIKRGDLLLMEAMGGGLTWGAAVVRW